MSLISCKMIILSVLNFILRVTIKFRLNRLTEFFFSRKLSIIRTSLFAFYKPLLSEFYNSKSNLSDLEINNVYVLWMQGYDNAPDIVKHCIDSLRKQNPDKHIHLITADNLDNYTVGMSSEVVEKYKQGLIKIQLFSDILRAFLLSTHGGYWCDATLFFTAPLPKSSFNFYSVHNDNGMKTNVAHRRWTAYFLYAKSGDAVVTWLYRAMCYYVQHNDYLIDYFLIDYTIDCGYNNIPEIKQEIDSIPVNNLHVTALTDILGQQVNDFELKKIMADTILFKLSWKVSFDSSLEGTYYKWLCSRVI